MAKARRRDSAGAVLDRDNTEATAPQSTGDTTAANLDRGRIAARAYEKYLARGGQPGRELDDWLEAERELNQGAGEGGGQSDPNA